MQQLSVLADQKMTTVLSPVDVLLVSTNIEKHTTLASEAYRVHCIEDISETLSTLSSAEYDLIILDEATINEELPRMVKEIKRQRPEIQILAWSSNPNASQDMLKSGVDDFMVYGLSSEEMHRQLHMIMQRKSSLQNDQTQTLQAITWLVGRLHRNQDTQSLINESIDLICSTFKVYGIAIVLHEAQNSTLYAGRAGVASGGRLFKTALQDDSLFQNVIETGTMQVIENVAQEALYTPVPVLRDAASAVMLPLNIKNNQSGVIAFFGSAQQPLNLNNYAVYELLATQLSVAWTSIQKQVTTTQPVPQQDLPGSLQQFAELRDPQMIAEMLHDQIAALPGIKHPFVWINFDGNTHQAMNLPHIDEQFLIEQLNQSQIVPNHLLPMFNEPRQAITLQIKRGHQNPLGPLFRGLLAQQLVAFPVVCGETIVGAAVVSPEDVAGLVSDTAHVVEVLTYAAGQALENLQPAGSSHEDKTSRLETVLGSIHDGIIIVDEDGRVSFCNPKFADLTGVEPATDSTIEPLVEQLVPDSVTRANLQNAIQNIQNGDETQVTLPLHVADQDVQFQLHTIPDGGFFGVIRQEENTSSQRQSFLIDAILEHMRLPYTHVRTSVSSLVEEHRRFNQRELSAFLGHLEENVEDVKHLWDNFKGVYDVEFSSITLRHEATNLLELVQQVMNCRPFNKQQQRFHITAAEGLPLVSIDMGYIEQVISNLLQNAVDFSPKESIIAVELKKQGAEVHLIVEDQGMGIPADQMDKVFSPLFHASNNTAYKGAGVGLYLSKHLVEQHGGSIQVESELYKGTRFTVILPVDKAAPVAVAPSQIIPMPVEMPREATATPQPAPIIEMLPQKNEAVSRVPERSLQTIMVIKGMSEFIHTAAQRLNDQGYDLLSYNSAADALSDLKLTRIDLILMDAQLRGADSLKVCEWIRKQSQVPIILVGADTTDSEKVRALNMGADDYLVQSISEAEFMARLNVIFKRQRIPDVTREPLQLGDLQIDFAQRKVYLHGKPVEMTRIQYELLHALAVNRGQVLTHKQLLEKVWGPEYQGETQYLWVNISRLRKKLEPDVDEPIYIHNVPGIGYMFKS